MEYNQKDEEGNFILSPLTYTDDYLEPYIGERTLRFHYYKHLKTYIDNVNRLKVRYAGNVTIEKLILRSWNRDTPLYRNASQVFNHYFYFEQLNPRGAKEPLPMMGNLIEWFGGLDLLKSQIIQSGMEIFGSGWVFLTFDGKYNLYVQSFSGTGTPTDRTPLLALDVWEHAYYLDYQNDRKKYIEGFFEAIDWSIIEERLKNFCCLQGK